MNRSGYSDNHEAPDGEYFLWRHAVQRSIDGKRGQYMLRDLLAALDAMPNKVLAAEPLVSSENDDPGGYATVVRSGSERWRYMRNWVSRQIKAYGEVK